MKKTKQYTNEFEYSWGKTKLKYFCHKCKREIIVSRKDKNTKTIRCPRDNNSNLDFRGYL